MMLRTAMGISNMADVETYMGKRARKPDAAAQGGRENAYWFCRSRHYTETRS